MSELRTDRARRKKLPITIYLHAEQSDALDRLSAETRVAQAHYIRDGIDLVLDKREAELRAKGAL